MALLSAVALMRDQSISGQSFVCKLLDRSHGQVDYLMLRHCFSLAKVKISSLEIKEALTPGVLILAAAIKFKISLGDVCKYLSDKNIVGLPEQLLKSIGVIVSEASKEDIASHWGSWINRLLLRSPIPALHLIKGMSSSGCLNLSNILLVDSMGDAFWSLLFTENDDQRNMAIGLLPKLVADEVGILSLWARIEKTFAGKSPKAKKSLLMTLVSTSKFSETSQQSSLKALLNKEVNEDIVYLLVYALAKVDASPKALAVLWSEYSSQSKFNIKTAYLAALCSFGVPEEKVKGLSGKKEISLDTALLAISSPVDLKDMIKLLIRPCGLLSEQGFSSLLAKYPFVSLEILLSRSAHFDEEVARYAWKSIIKALLDSGLLESFYHRFSLIVKQESAVNVRAFSDAIKEFVSSAPLTTHQLEYLCRLGITMVKNETHKLELAELAFLPAFMDLKLWDRLNHLNLPDSTKTDALVVFSQLNSKNIHQNQPCLSAVLENFPQVVQLISEKAVELLSAIDFPTELDQKIIAASESSLPVVDGTSYPIIMPIYWYIL